MSLAHVLLGILSRGPGSGWDLKSRLERDPALGWDADLAQIYPTLRKLLRGGFVGMKRRRSTKGPSKQEYRLTASGRREFLAWLGEPLELARTKDASLARLAFLEREDRPQQIERLRLYRAKLVGALKGAGSGGTAARRRYRVLLEAELGWVDGELMRLTEEAGREAASDRDRGQPGSSRSEV